MKEASELGTLSKREGHSLNMAQDKTLRKGQGGRCLALRGECLFCKVVCL